MRRLQGRVCIVTGAAQGIGYATARRLLDDGATVAICDIRRESVDTAVEALGQIGPTEGHVVDVTRRDEIEAMTRADALRHCRTPSRCRTETRWTARAVWSSNLKRNRKSC